jgi:hypothetical protein
MALVLEKIKPVDGDVLFVTQSSYLAENARGRYCANGFEREEQDVGFLSYREFLQSLRVPERHEAHGSDFSSEATVARFEHRVARAPRIPAVGVDLGVQPWHEDCFRKPE